MTQRYLAHDPRVHRWEGTDDVLQVALLKLHRALEKIKPIDLRGYMVLAAVQIRRTLIDLARHYYGKEGIGKNHATDAAPGQDGLPARVAAAADSADGPEDLALSPNETVLFNKVVGDNAYPQEWFHRRQQPQ
jgi:hypothetical protein